jgi:hypothetical protein
MKTMALNEAGPATRSRSSALRRGQTEERVERGSSPVENGGVSARRHDGPAATPAARALAATEEETVALGSGAESGGDRGRRRRCSALQLDGEWRRTTTEQRRRRWHDKTQQRRTAAFGRERFRQRRSECRRLLLTHARDRHCHP